MSNSKANDRYWVYNTYYQWQKQLPHLSETTIKRSINKLEKQNNFQINKEYESCKEADNHMLEKALYRI